jgi:DNA-binding MarR family transcriptional regulator
MRNLVKTPLDEALISKVQEDLPAQPWPCGVHKVIAQQLGLSNGTVSHAIQVLIQRGLAKQQNDGVVLEGRTPDQANK